MSADLAEVRLDTDQTELLPLTQIASTLGVSYERLLGFANARGVKEYVGAKPVPGKKGDRYPPDAEEVFRVLIHAQDKGVVTPGTAYAFLTTLKPTGNNGQALTSLPTGMAQARDLTVAIVDAIKQAGLAAPVDDELLTADEVATRYLKCKPGSVAGKLRRAHVHPATRGRWRRSDVLAYIQHLGR